MPKESKGIVGVLKKITKNLEKQEKINLLFDARIKRLEQKQLQDIEKK